MSVIRRRTSSLHISMHSLVAMSFAVMDGTAELLYHIRNTGSALYLWAEQNTTLFQFTPEKVQVLIHILSSRVIPVTEKRN